MLISFLGDSITQGAAASSSEKRYVDRVGAILGCEVKNYGLGGTRIAKQKKVHYSTDFDENFLIRAERMDPNSDFAFCFGGTNDFGHGDAPLGEDDSTSDWDFCGAVNNLFRYLEKKFGKEKVTVILPLHRRDEFSPHGEFGIVKQGINPLLEVYSSVLRRKAIEHGFDILDLGDKITHKDAEEGLLINPEDGLHPTDAGHEIIAQAIVEHIKKKRNK